MDFLKKQGSANGKKNQRNSATEPGPSTSRAEEDVPGTSEERTIDLSPAGLMKFLNLGGANDDEDNISNINEAENAPNETGQDGFRMSEDGYPMVVDLGPSERQSLLAKQRLIEEVIQEQNQAFDQDVLEELERAQMQGVFEEDEDHAEQQQQQQNKPSRAANSLHHEGIPLTPRAEAALANYMVRKFSEVSRLEPPMEIPPVEETRPVNILPASRHLELPVNSLVAFGRKPNSGAGASGASRHRRPANSVDHSPLGWQASKPQIKDRIEFMFCNELLADVYFFVGKEEHRQRIPAHKFVLSIGSVVFDAMFNGGLTPQNSREALEIELPDVEPSAFLTLLKFLYTDNVKIEPENVMTTLYTAKKYAVPAMESACVDFLKKSLGADNAFMLLTQARLFDEPQLEQLCLELIDKNTHDALAGEGFNDIDVNTLCAVLTRDTLRVREALLFQAVVRWAAEECARRGFDNTPENKRTVLGDALHLIRFPLMTIEEFAQTAAQSGLLTDREVVNLFLYFTVNPKPNTCFNDTPRCAIAGKEMVVCRFQRNEVRWGYSGIPDRIKFTVDRPIYVIGFGLYGGISGPQEYPVTIQIIHCGTGKVMAQNETSFVCDGSSATFRVLFRDPVEITPSVTYIASAFLKGQDSHYGTKGLRRIVHQSAAGTVTFQFTYAAGNNNGTSVEDGQIPEIIFYTNTH